jgi:uncharacterized protein YndB with AHSA1/START domain
VWHALTDRAVLSQWFMRTDLEPSEGRRFWLMPDGLLGIAGPLEGELVEVTAPRRLVMLWRGEQVHSRVTWDVVPLPSGCRLRISHTGFIGVHGSLRRKELVRTYDRMLAERLPRVLDALAGVPEPEPEPEPEPTPGPPALLLAIPPLPNGPEPEPAENDPPPRRTGPLAWLHAVPHRRRGQLLAVAGAILLAVLTTALISGLSVPALLPPFGGTPEEWPTPGTEAAGSSPGVVPPPAPASPGATPGGAATASPVPAAGRPGGSVGAPAPTGTPGPGGGPPGEPGGRDPAWRAGYRTVSGGGAEFTGEIEVTNAGTGPARDWSVAVTLPDGADLASVSGASASAAGGTVTFTAANSRKLPSGKSTTFTFRVTGATGPTSCRIDGQPCAGLSG